ncbi:MAG: undecaprenyldiphospho-muramoylpentapeptide beta-N-acetylglucosaminyltransferase [Thermodesulfobacteriota bacterium]
MVVAGGGTGGHLFPALSLADELRRRNSSCEIVVIGGRGGLEEKIVPERGYRLELLGVEGLKGRRGMRRIRSLFKAVVSTFKAAMILRRLKPVGVLGSGSYSSGPVVLAASLLRIKTAILEQNALPGMTNRLLGRFVNRVYVAFEEASAYFPSRSVILAGNPIRREMLEDFRKREKNWKTEKGKEFTILVFGGSQGAKAINTALLDALEYLTDILGSIRVIHQTGIESYEEVKVAYERKGLLSAISDKVETCRVEVYRFIEDMSSVYSSADLVICRAGATSLAEIMALGLAAILIPYPLAADNHQEINAKVLSEKGAAIMLRQEGLTGRVLADEIRRLYRNPGELDALRVTSKSLGKPMSLDIITDDYMQLLGMQ